jgi:hypothetical protein
LADSNRTELVLPLHVAAMKSLPREVIWQVKLPSAVVTPKGRPLPPETPGRVGVQSRLLGLGGRLAEMPGHGFGTAGWGHLPGLRRFPFSPCWHLGLLR